MGFRLPPRRERQRTTFSTPMTGFERMLETRLALSTASAIVMDSATTVDSHGVTIDYDIVTPPTTGQPLTFGVYRSASTTFDSSAIAVGSETISPTMLDANGLSATAVGPHKLTIPLANGLPLNPEHSDVLVVANPTSALASGDPLATASFHVNTIAVVTHGGLQLHRYDNSGPPWEQEMAYYLRQQGYSTAIPFNWVIESNTAGEAALQAPRLTRDVLAAAAKFPSNDVVDIQFIGHSEGTVINALAISKLEGQITPEIKAGWIEETMLDPHAANTGVPGQQYSVANNPLGWLAKAEIDDYQSKAKDPAPTVPAGVDNAQVFYQHTPADKSNGENDDIYNLWGQVPVRGNASYFNLTGDRVTHSGDTAIYTWYERNIVPTLGNGGASIAADTLIANVSAPTANYPNRPVYAGTMAPGSFVRVMIGPASDPSKLTLDARAIAQPDGTWSVVGQPVLNGNYRVIAQAFPPRGTASRLAVISTAPMGAIKVGS